MKAIKKLTRKQAWLKIARAFNKYKNKGLDVTQRLRSSGLCNAIDALQYDGLIDYVVWDEMIDQISTYKIENHIFRAYIWSTGEAGARKRAALARKFAKE